MSARHPSPLTKNAQTLRRNMTKEERRLWYDFLKTIPCNAKRQKVVGRYIVDFYIPQAQLIIELDGSQHYEENGRQADGERDAFLKSEGFSILRYSNHDVNHHFQAVCEDILNHINSSCKK